ncbi:hypothetical protein TorRG33x02_059130 [Trema orientale]|uniref:Uncharacterized protein n=1 Tax=Trema orientale TaxID=63057 RepID=A0A2P5FKL3_TREOI|nr:hypothetical protein TorRG33x02_059130 [Trema orientale]
MYELFDRYTAELLAMRKILCFAINSEFTVAILESDSLTAVCVVQTKSKDLSIAGLIIADIISLLSSNRDGYSLFGEQNCPFTHSA